MFTLKSVTLRNFRSVNDAVFEPLVAGVTGLSGLNGVGKSSFLEGMLWALFDVRGDGISVKHLRRIGADPSEECFVAVVFEHEGSTIEVIRELRGKNARAVVNIYLDGIEQTHTSVKVANEWLRERLRIDPDGFKTAFVVRQKELDSLVRARPAERRATIERLSGIEKLSAALKRARENENVQKREVASLPGTQESVDNAAALVQAQELHINDLTHEILEMEEFVAEKKADVDSLAELANIANQANIARERLDSAQNSLDSAHARLEAEGEVSANVSLEQVEEAKQELAALDEKLQEARHEHAVASARKNALVEERSRLVADITKAEDLIRRGLEAIQEIEQNATHLELANEEATQHETDISRLTTEVSRLSSENSNIKSRVAKIKNILATLRENADNAHCPTCKSALTDINELSDDFEEEMATLLASERGNIALLSSLREQENKSASSLAKIRIKIRDLQGSVAQRPSIESSINEARQQVDANRVRIAALEGESSENDLGMESLVKQGKSIAAMFADGQQLLQSLVKSYESGERIAMLQREKSEWEERVKGAQASLESVLTAAHNHKAHIPLSEVAARYTQASGAHRAQEQALSELISERRVQDERLSSLQRDLQREENMFERKRVALQNLSEFAAVSDTLDEFRKDRIAQIAPELSETATALISSMTSGRFTEVLLDEDFTPSVINDAGEELSVSQLSGGEESIVALALRVALGDLITGGVAGLLWLDEVLTAQDAARRSSLMNTLSHIAGRQIVLISHTPESTDSVDKIVHLVATDNGSFLAED